MDSRSTFLHLSQGSKRMCSRRTVERANGYPAHAPEGGVSLEPYPHVRAWLARVEALPGFVGMPATRAGLLAA